MLFSLSFLLCWLFCLKSIREIKSLGPAGADFQRILSAALGVYFVFGFFLARAFPYSFIFLALPAGGVPALAFFLQKQRRQTLFDRLRDLALPISAKMKLGSGFIDSWEKSVREMDRRGIEGEILKISDALLFQKNFRHPDRRIEDIVHHLRAVRNSPHPLRRLRHLEQKLKTERAFYRKSGQVLLQLRIQSGVLACLYLGLLVWTALFYGSRHVNLMLASFFCFSAGLFWIMKTGRKMKWSL